MHGLPIHTQEVTSLSYDVPRHTHGVPNPSYGEASYIHGGTSLTHYVSFFFLFFFEILCGNGILCLIRHCCFLSRFLLYNDVFSESVFYTLISSWLNRIFMVRSSFHGILWISPINHKARFKKNMLSPKSSFHFFFGFVFF